MASDNDEREELAAWCADWYVGAHSLQMDAVVVGILHRISAALRAPAPSGVPVEVVCALYDCAIDLRRNTPIDTDRLPRSFDDAIYRADRAIRAAEAQQDSRPASPSHDGRPVSTDGAPASSEANGGSRAGATAPATAAELVAKARARAAALLRQFTAGEHDFDAVLLHALAAALEQSDRDYDDEHARFKARGGEIDRLEERIAELERERDETADKARELIDSLYASLDRIKREVGRGE